MCTRSGNNSLLHVMDNYEQEIKINRLERRATIEDWYTYAEQVTIAANIRVQSGVVERGWHGHEVTLVLDICEHMRGDKFESMKSDTKRYIEGLERRATIEDWYTYAEQVTIAGVQQIKKTRGLEENVEIVLLGGQSRLLHEHTSEYGLLLTLIEGEAPLVGGLIMGMATVQAGTVARMADINVKGHMIMFTDSTSPNDFPDKEQEVVTKNDGSHLEVKSQHIDNPCFSLELEEHVSRMDTKYVEYANNLDNATKQMSNLLLKTSRLNVLVDNLQNMANLGKKNRKDGSSDLSTNDEYSEYSLNVIENNESVGIGKISCRENAEASDEDTTEYKSDNECCSADANIYNFSSYVNGRTVGPLTNAVQCYESNIYPYKPLGENSDTKFFKKLGSCSDNDNGQNASTNSTRSEESILDENIIEEDNPLNTLNKEKGNEISSEIENCNTPYIKTTIRKNESGYKSKIIKTQNDNRVSFHTIHKSYGENTKEKVCRTDLQREDSNVSNIKPTEHITDDIRPMMKSVTSYRTPRRSTRRGHEEDIYDERLFDAGQPKTVREWYQYTKQMTEYASARMRSRTVKLGRSPNVVLVLDTSERMTGCFQKLRSAALQYVYGIKQSSECGDIENGIGLAVFGRETRLIQEPTSDYELVIELIERFSINYNNIKGHLRPEGDAPVLAGLLMGYAGVVSCFLGCFKDIVLQAHMIVFTNGSSEQCKLSTENGENFIFALRRTRLLAIQIASDIRYLKDQSRDVIRRRISNHSSLDDKHEDCLDMVPDFINPLRFDNMKGLYLELGCHTLTLGNRVRRGPDWTYRDQDLGLPGTAVGYDRDGWVIVEWDHGNILPYPHDEQMDRLQIRKVNEPRILIDELIAVGCRVVRGRDWKYGDHDGGKGTEGTVLCVKQEDKVVVRWDGKKIGLYKFGYNGRFEVRLIDNYSNECEETDRYGHSEERFKEATTGKYKNAPYSMNANNCCPEDYVIPIYSETSSEQITITCSENSVLT
ncbi:unnamed protein product [Mytilus coruscus]|uniref:MIB/HERC2 domain-containing protein n=1 Tax=Mytilus coruscus TaxID=42192 RepID=A0A6J8DRF0_MYTCO|nr:unnamed protein product [Mytilus coruscus]